MILQGRLQPASTGHFHRSKIYRVETSKVIYRSGNVQADYRGFISAPLFKADSNSWMSPIDAWQPSQKLLFTDRCFSGYHPLSHREHVHLWMPFTLLRDFSPPVMRSHVSTEFLKRALYLYSSASIHIEWTCQLRSCLDLSCNRKMQSLKKQQNRSKSYLFMRIYNVQHQ